MISNDKIDFIKTYNEIHMPSVYPEMTYEILSRAWEKVYKKRPYRSYKSFRDSREYCINTGKLIN
jgi:hypothetical protein